MGLFSNVIHVWHRSAEEIESALEEVMQGYGLRRIALVPVPPAGPIATGDGSATYAVGARRGDWVTVVEVDVAEPGNPGAADVGSALSRALQTYVLSLAVHDDDILFYNLDLNGDSLDGYNSFPPYFEQERIDEADIEAQRHAPEAFSPLLPSGVSIGDLLVLLQRGWWAAHDAGELDEDGVPNDIDDGFVFEGERMVALGNLLQLHGASSEYPFAAWAEAPESAWEDFKQITFAPE